MERSEQTPPSGAEAERRVLLLPPTTRDAEALRDVFSKHDIDCWVYESMAQVVRALFEGAAALVVSEEALLADSAHLLRFLDSQPVWADLPILVLSRSGSESPKLTELLEKTGNVSVVERPVRISTFLSLVRVALRGRARQYEVREHLSQIRAAEAVRTALWESERSARAEAERVGRMKDEFLATLSHEIRTPLNAICGWTAILRRGVRSEEDLDKGLAVIERNARAQAQIVNDLLDMNRIINGKVRLEVKRILLSPVVQGAVDTITPAAEAKGIRLEMVLGSSPGLVLGDAERLQQVFWNLLSNAIKFTPKAGLVRIAIEQAGSHLEVSIVDTGEGIELEFLPHVFDRFMQADGSTTRRHTGLGLGLAIVKQLVELHGGSVRAKSPGLGRGSTFTVVLPLASAQEGSPAAAERRLPRERIASLVEDRASDMASVKVLVVDDDPDSRNFVERLLEGRGAKVTTAGSAGEALELMQSWQPDVLISDIGMPGQDGYSLMRSVRSIEAESGRHMVAIALTAYARAEDRTTAIQAGFQYHVAKPADPIELTAVVARAVRRVAGRS